MVDANQILKRALSPSILISFLVTVALCYVYVDLPVAVIVSQWHLRESSLILNWLTYLGDGSIVVIPLMAGLWFRYFNLNSMWECRSWYVTLSVLLAGFICLLLKVFFGRARPGLWFHIHEYGFCWLKMKSGYWSFPSGHTATILSAAFSLCLLFPKYRYAFIFIGFFVTLSRVLLGWHYLSDVVAGAYLAFLQTFILTYFIRNNGWFEI